MKPTGKCRRTASVDMKATRYFKELTDCTGDDDPYTAACTYCLVEDGQTDLAYTIEEIVALSKESKNI